MQLGQLQERLHKLASENASAKGVVEEVEEANEAMENRLKELSCTIGVLEAREQEFTSEIKVSSGPSSFSSSSSPSSSPSTLYSYAISNSSALCKSDGCIARH